MTDEVFRPERRPITQSDTTPESNQAQLDMMASIRANASSESDSVAMTPREGVKISGNIPPAMKEAIRARQTPKKQQPRFTNESEPIIQTSNKLAKLIEGIQGNKALYDEVILPSLGKFYDGINGPTDGKIHIRPMTGEEEEILATPRFVRKGQAINMIFDKCIQEKQYRAENFLTTDRTFLLIYLRGISYTPEYDVEVKCPSCDRKFATVIDLNSLEFEPCPQNFSESQLRDVLPTTGYNFSYRLSTGADEQKITEYRDRKIKGGFDMTGQADDTLLYRTAQLINEIGQDDVIISDKQEILALLRRLPINDVAYLRNLVNDPPFGVNTTVDIDCPGCTQNFEIDLPLEANFFFPRGRKKTPTNQY